MRRSHGKRAGLQTNRDAIISFMPTLRETQLFWWKVRAMIFADMKSLMCHCEEAAQINL
jgi:hypothetical protein